MGHLRRRRLLPTPVAVPTRPGPQRLFLTPPVLAAPQLLDSRQQEALVWGIDRFVDTAPTRRLALAATVRATARAGGIPTLRYTTATYQRQVWLWVDDTVADRTMTRLAEEVTTTLQAHGLTVERAVFRGMPERFLTTAGTVMTPRELDEYREAILVAVLTDGRVLSRLYTVDHQRVRIAALLRELSHWPRQAFVDFSPGAQTLAGILAPYDLQCIAPAALAAFLGAEATLHTPRDIQSADAVWAAACALAPSSVDEATALALLLHLRQQCGLSVSPWALRALSAEAPGPAGRLQWPPALRARRLNWLKDMQTQPHDSTATSVLHTALDFWERRIKQELQRPQHSATDATWQDDPAWQHLRME